MKTPFIILLLFKLSLSYSLTSTTLKDLDVISDATSWTLSSSVCPSCSKTYTTPPNTCGIPQETILGGPKILGPNGGSTNNQYFERYYTGLNFPSMATALEFDLWVFYNSVPSNPSNTNFFGFDFDLGQGVFKSMTANLLNSCQLDYTDAGGNVIKAFYKFHVKVLFSHKWIPNLRTRIISKFTVASTISSFGFKNLQYFSTSTLSINDPLAAANFPCATSLYWDGTICKNCYNIDCGICTGAAQAECTSCKDGSYDYGSKKCLSTCPDPFEAITSNGYPYLCQPKCPTTYFWFYNKGCTSTCGTPLTSSVDANGLKICSNPCYYNDATSAYVNKFLYPDQACLATCPAPLQTKSPGLCASPCTNGNDFVFKNGSCTSQCIAPLVGTTVNGIKYCNSPCTGQYIYLDGTCLATCAAPLVKFDESSDIKYCRTPCANVNDYIFKNGSCTSQCLSPLLAPPAVKGNKFCNSPCTGQYIYPDGSCSASCSAPVIKFDESADIKYCRTPCANVNHFVFKNGSCTSQCIAPLLGTTANGVKSCSSPCTGQYIYLDGSCSASCSAPLVKFDESADIKYCRTPCTNVNDYAFKNGSCTNQCLSPLLAPSNKGNKFCNSPCTGQYIYLDGSCSASCNAPLVKFDESPDIKYCRASCAASDYIFKNGSCTSQCLSPLLGTTVNSIKYCNSPCAAQYIYLDGSCATSCPAPLVKFDESNDIKYCRTPCPNVNDFLYKNGTCISLCPSLLASSTVKGNHFCDSPCPGQYIYQNGTCSTQCLPPMVKREESADVKFCVTPCANPLDYLYEAEKRCSPTCISPYEPKTVSNVKLCFLSENLNSDEDTKAMVSTLTKANKIGAAGGKGAAALSSTSPAFAFLAGQIAMLFSIRYIDVGYPEKVKLMFQMQGASPFSLSFDFNIPDGVEKKLVKRTPPEIFEEYEVPSNFLENAWDTLMTLILTLFSILVLSVIVKLIKGKGSVVGKILGGILSFLKWNIPLVIFCSSFGDMYLFASLQFNSGMANSTAWEIMSFTLAVFMMLAGIGVLILSFIIAKDTLRGENSDEKWKNFELLFSAQKRNSLASLCHMAFYLSVTILSNLIIGNLYDYPLVEALLVTVISVIMFSFLAIQRPLNETRIFVQVLINQLLLVTVNFCVVILGIMDELGIVSQGTRDNIGQVIIVIFFLSMASGLAFAVVELLCAIFSLYKIAKKLKAQDKLSVKSVFHALIHEEKENPLQKKSSLSKLALQQPRKAKNSRLNTSQNPLNTSTVELVHQTSDSSSLDLPTINLGFSPAKSSRTLQRRVPLKNLNQHRILKEYQELKIPNQADSGPAKEVADGLPQNNNVFQFPYKSERVRENRSLLSEKRKVSRSPERSHSQSRKNDIKKERYRKQLGNLFDKKIFNM